MPACLCITSPACLRAVTSVQRPTISCGVRSDRRISTASSRNQRYAPLRVCQRYSVARCPLPVAFQIPSGPSPGRGDEAAMPRGMGHPRRDVKRSRSAPRCSHSPTMHRSPPKAWQSTSQQVRYAESILGGPAPQATLSRPVYASTGRNRSALLPRWQALWSSRFNLQ